VKRVTDIMADIMSASQEQSNGINQVNQAVSAMDQATQQNAALVEHAADASGSLQDQAVRLAELVSVFKLGDNHAPARPKVQAPKVVARVANSRIVPVRTEPVRKQIATAPAASQGDWKDF
jgi:hypothetical protein